MNNILNESINIKDWLTSVRRDLHSTPELGLEEFITKDKIIKYLKEIGINYKVFKNHTGIIAYINTPNANKTIAIRADIDALPINENNNVDYKSIFNRKMHACGHDAHTAILMMACHYFNSHFNELTGEIWAIFQHAEERLPGGASELVATGIFHELDFMYGHHLWSLLPVGTIDLKDGPVTANTDVYTAKIIGKGGHSSEPQNCIDPTLIAAQIVCKLQSIVARQVAPLEAGVISNTYINSGRTQALNVIPSYAEIGGSVRSTTPEMRALFKQQITRMIRSTCEDFDATCDIDYQLGYGITENNLATTAIVRSIAETIPEANVIQDPPYLCGEDFSAFSHIVPSTFAFIGVGNVEKDCIYPHHHPKFNMDEDGFLLGLQMFVNVALNYRNLKK